MTQEQLPLGDRVRLVRCDKGEAPPIEFGDDVPPTEFLIMPMGEFRTTNGVYLVDEESAAAILSDQAQRGVDFVIDYEHQTISSESNGREAPAAGWFNVEVRDDGIYAVNCRWTERATAYLQAREYRYHSPVFVYDDKSKRVLSIEMESLVNYPASLAQMPLAAKDATNAVLADGESDITSPANEEITMAEQKGHDEALAVLKADVEKKDSEIAVLTKRVAEAEEATKATEALLADAMSAAGVEKKTELIGACKAGSEAREKAEKLSARLDEIKAEQDEAEKSALVEKAGAAADTIEWLKEQTLDTVRSYVERCCKTPEVDTTVQHTEAKKDDAERAPEDWFVTYCNDKGIREEEKVAAEWRDHLKYASKVKPSFIQDAE